MRASTLLAGAAVALPGFTTALDTTTLSLAVAADSAAVTSPLTNGTAGLIASSTSSTLTTTSGSASGAGASSGATTTGSLASGTSQTSSASTSSSESPGSPGNAGQTGASNSQNQNAAAALGLEGKLKEVMLAGVGVVAGFML